MKKQIRSKSKERLFTVWSCLSNDETRNNQTLHWARSKAGPNQSSNHSQFCLAPLTPNLAAHSLYRWPCWSLLSCYWGLCSDHSATDQCFDQPSPYPLGSGTMQKNSSFEFTPKSKDWVYHFLKCLPNQIPWRFDFGLDFGFFIFCFHRSSAGRQWRRCGRTGPCPPRAAWVQDVQELQHLDHGSAVKHVCKTLFEW